MDQHEEPRGSRRVQSPYSPWEKGDTCKAIGLAEAAQVLERVLAPALVSLLASPEWRLGSFLWG